MDIEKMRTIIYHPLKQQKLPKCIKKNFNKFAISTYDLIYHNEMFDFRRYINYLLDNMHEKYHFSNKTDDSMYGDAIRLYCIIYHKLYNISCFIS